MNKIFYFSIVIVIFCCSILFGLPYVGVNLSTFLVVVLAIFIPIMYLSRPKIIKNTQKEISKCLNDIIQEINSDNAKKREEKSIQIKRELDSISTDEISIISQNDIDILKYIRIKNILKKDGYNYTPEEIISEIKKLSN